MPREETVPRRLTGLGITLGLIKEADGRVKDYQLRYKLVMMAVAQACEAGYRAGFRYDPNPPEPRYPLVAYIELGSVGQVSWHMPEHEEDFDGHTVAEKYERIAEWLNGGISPWEFLEQVQF